MVTKVIDIFFPISEVLGVYVNEKMELVVDEGLTDPPPFSVIVILLALPPNVLPVKVNGVVPHELPIEPFRVIIGHCPKRLPQITKNKKNTNKTFTI